MSLARGFACRARIAALVLVASLLPRSPVEAQELGHKLLGALGVSAGTQPEPGFYVLERTLFYRAGQLRDRNGRLIPIAGLRVGALAGVVGLSFTAKLTRGPYYTASIGGPIAHVSVNADNPHIAIDAAGLGDVFVQPVKLGARLSGLDVVAGYAFYAPTGLFEPRTLGVGRGYWTHELSMGGALHIGRERTARASLLASYDFNGRKSGIDIRRGNTFQLQGGAGAKISRLLDAGVAGFALWQVADNTGSELPDAVRGARTRAFGLGPELGTTITSLRLRIDARAEWELGVRSRQDGWILIVSASAVAWRPASEAAAEP